jgi:hypothetical protein
MARRKAGKAVTTTKTRATKKVVAKKTRRASTKAGAALAGTQNQGQERLRELTAWYMLQGMDEATARERARRAE